MELIGWLPAILVSASFVALLFVPPSGRTTRNHYSPADRRRFRH